MIAATDPLNLVGQLTPGPRVPAVAENRILIRDGVPIASWEAGELVVRAPIDETTRIIAEHRLRSGVLPAVAPGSEPDDLPPSELN